MHHTHTHSHAHGDGHGHSHSHGGYSSQPSNDEGFSRNRSNPPPAGLNGGIGNGGMVPIDIEDPSKGTESTDAPPLPKVKVLCVDMTKFSPISQLTLLSAGVFFFFMLNGFIEEYTFAFLDDFKFGWYMTFYELLCFGGFAVAERLTTHEKILDHNAPLSRHMMIAVAMTAARGLTNVSLQYLNYPTQVIFKSMKLVTVMIGSVFCLSKSFAPREYASALLLVTSAVFFSLGDFSFGSASTDSGSKTDMMGIVIVSLSLVADAAHSNTQEYVLQNNKATILETMLFTNVFSAVLCFLYIVYTGEFVAAIAYCSERPITYPIFIIRSFVIYCGVLCFASLVKRFDVVVATTVTTVRKILTIVCSFILFPKAFSMNYIYGTIAFLLSIYVGMKPKAPK